MHPGPRWRAVARGRRILVLALGLAWAVHADGQIPPTRLAFDGRILVLAWQGGAPGEAVREYIPPGEKLASIREYPKLDDPRAVAANLVRALKQQNPAAQSAMIENPATGEDDRRFRHLAGGSGIRGVQSSSTRGSRAGGWSPSSTPCGSTRTPPGS